MTKKFVIPTIAVLLVALFAGFWFSTNALADDGQPGKPNGLMSRLRKANAVLGQVTAINDAQFTIQTRSGEEKTFAVDEDTRFRSKDKTDLSLADLQEGAWVAVSSPRRGTGEGTARFVILLPADFDPAKLPERHAGEIIAVDEAAGTLTLKTIKGEEELTFAVDENTRLKGKGDSLQELGDLQEGMYGLVVSKTADGELAAMGGDPLAVLVAAGEKGDLQKFAQNRRSQQGNQGQQGRRGQIVDKAREALAKYDKRMGGKIVSLTANSFTIEARDGQQYTLAVDNQTIFRSRGDQVTGLQDLKEGMLVLVGADEAAGGSYQAGLVLVMAPKK